MNVEFNLNMNESYQTDYSEENKSAGCFSWLWFLHINVQQSGEELIAWEKSSGIKNAVCEPFMKSGLHWFRVAATCSLNQSCQSLLPLTLCMWCTAISLVRGLSWELERVSAYENCSLCGHQGKNLFWDGSPLKGDSRRKVDHDECGRNLTP